MDYLGSHLLVELYDCDEKKLNDLNLIESVLEEAVRVSGATALKSSFHQFAPQGVSGVVIIAESHFTIHTWPEYNYAALDIFTCGNTVNNQKALVFIEKELDVKTLSVTEMKRGNIHFPIKINRKTSAKVGVF
ncbi:MAG: adenosylmethionine decarboxylase [Candidatus Caldatribacteriota bacterium]|jgi:S-adenosylmethionine decarboxylase|nr:adenosylmethionine decarboxylase [Atribacterota bacterium]MDD3030815.1 adenosylmethionine decarboxylase [Atribacterota bacterium]MDD3641077.1 adenosylmethionine decarboxylase [Atribacterota bacterium]MDD4288987.1 adenosylmethionine decarboxylase [Atribacterota bacterium]MDD4764832.1 adenosylmethionine decarboxylase [Atribacterota bacterium]